jgi:hypothetical protein
MMAARRARRTHAGDAGTPRRGTAAWSTPGVGSSGSRVARGARTPGVAQAV